METGTRVYNPKLLTFRNFLVPVFLVIRNQIKGFGSVRMPESSFHVMKYWYQEKADSAIPR
jgi:hypothetical protein